MNHVWVFGSLNDDLIVRTTTLPRPGETVTGIDVTHGLGGKGANQAVAAARLGVPTHFVGAVGEDSAGERLAALLAGDGVELSALEVFQGHSGMAVVIVDAAGENSIVVIPGANGSVTAAAAESLTFGPGDVLVVQGELPWPATRAALQRCRDLGATSVWNPAPASSEIVDDLGLADILIVNEIELETLSGTAVIDDGLLALVGSGARQAIATLGPHGVVGIVEGGRVVRLPAREVEVVDTTGAGDCFVGVLAARLAAGDPIGVALRWAVAASSLVIQRLGAAPSMPSGPEVASVL